LVFSVAAGFNLRFLGGPRQQLQPHNLFVTVRVADQVDQARRALPTPRNVSV